MANYLLTWDAVTVDDAGQPVVVSEYRIIKNGSTSTTVPGGTLQATVVVNAGETAVLGVEAVGPGGIGARTEVTVTEPSGVPAAPANVAATRQ